MKNNSNGVSIEKYKLVKEKAKKTDRNARAKVYKELCEKLDTKETEKNINITVRIRESLKNHVL